MTRAQSILACATFAISVMGGCSDEQSKGVDEGNPVASGGATSSVDTVPSQGTTVVGGNTSVGGSVGSKGGASSAGGNAVKGGSSSSGGSSAKGGASSAGGSVAKGGTSSSGGARSSAKGGASSVGGSVAKGGTSASGGNSSRPTFHVFLLLGQSNMAGYSKAQATDKVQEPRVRVLGYDNCSATGRVQDKWAVAVPPLHECWNGALGPGDWFAKTIVNEVPAGDTIGLVPCAISGEKIETFMKVGGAKYSFIVNRAKLAQQAGGIIDGILFHQGESNCGDSTWPSKVATLVSDLRTDLGLGNVPFLAGQLVPTGACAQHNTQVAKLPNLIPNAYVVSATGLVLDSSDTTWRLHFDHDSQVTLGKRYAETMISALKW
jgi:hypothetical protein